MKCVGAEDGQQPCQRCKRSNTEYVTRCFLPYFLHSSHPSSFPDAFLKNTGEGANLVQSQSFLRFPVLIFSLTLLTHRLSEASKMLRRLEKGLSNAKRISQTVDSALANGDSRLSSVGEPHVRCRLPPSLTLKP